MFIQPETFIEFCYETFLQRAADIEGKRYYLEQIKLGWSFQEVIQSFLQSSEFQQHQQNSQNNQNNNEHQRKFITNLYKYLLKRNRKRSGGLKKKKDKPFPSSHKIRQLSKSHLHQNK